VLLAVIDPEPPSDVGAMQGPALKGEEREQPLHVLRHPDRTRSRLELETPKEAQSQPVALLRGRVSNAEGGPQRQISWRRQL
jgi:hypothetical protein